MKTNILFLISFFTVSFSMAQDCQQVFEEFLTSETEDFMTREESPLNEKDFRAFESLNYYEFNPEYCVTARFERADVEETFQMPTTTSRLPEYQVYGYLSFELQGSMHTLTVYQNIELIKEAEYKDYLFLPFTDETNGELTYAGGRYIDLQGPLEQLVILDFNQTYNPYCAYNANYSCPIPPKENHLDIAIGAGVKKWKEY